MKIISSLFHKTAPEEEALPEPAEAPAAPAPEMVPEAVEPPAPSVPVAPVAPVAAPRPAPVAEIISIWDSVEARLEQTPEIATHTDDRIGDHMAVHQLQSALGAAPVICPVGWMVITNGPGRGHVFALEQGITRIGRGKEVSLALDFGDPAIPHGVHAAIDYDFSTRKCRLSQTGQAVSMSLNGKHVLPKVVLADGDHVQIGTTTLMMKTLCGADFDWSDEKETDDAAIA